MRITKKFETKENVFVLFSLMNIIYYNSANCYPKKVDKKIHELLDALIEYLEKDYLDWDIDDYKLIREVTFIKK